MNKVLLIGRVGTAPKTDVFENGKKVTKLSLATTEFFGKDNKDTTWHQITVWGDYGETMSKFINVGSQISVEGRIQNSAYEKEGVKCISSTIVVDKIELLDKKSDSSVEQAAPSATAPNTTTSTKVSTPAKTIVPAPAPGDDLPF